MDSILKDIEDLTPLTAFGRVSGVQGLRLEVAGIAERLHVGSRLRVEGRVGAPVSCEVVGIEGKKAICLPFGPLDGIGVGCPAHLEADDMAVFPSPHWLGRVVNAMGDPIDGKGPLVQGLARYPLKGSPPAAHNRQRVGGKLDLGVRALNTFVTCCQGQRMGIFAGSGVGKSVLMSMLARYTASDISVIGLIGERGREVQEFIEDDLGPEGMARSIVVVATSDEPALVRRQAAYLTLALSEFFRDQGAQVLCLMDSVTRFAMAQREIGLSGGEPPTTKGYPPTVFSELPKLLERAGPGAGAGAITGLFTVLVEGSDFDEPIADAVRGILDGHVILDRSIAERGRYPAIDVLRSVSRTMPNCNSEAETELVTRARRLLSTYEDMAELIRLGAYRKGADPAVDEAIHYYPMIDGFLSQEKQDQTTLEECYGILEQIIGSSVQDIQTDAAEANES